MSNSRQIPSNNVYRPPLNLCTIKSPTNGRFTSDKGNSYHAHKMCEGVKKQGFHIPNVNRNELKMDENTFPSLSNKKKEDHTNTNIMNFKEKINSINTEKEEPKKDELPKGWIVLDKNYRKQNSKKLEKEMNNESTEEIDINYLVNFLKKRKEDYYNLYGEDNYRKVFGFVPNYGVEEDVESNNSSDIDKNQEEEDLSSIE